jgi:hypothetical protein
MPSDRALLERQMADVELRPFTLDEFHRRRHQKQQNRRIATGVVGLVLAAVVAGGVLAMLATDDETVDSDVLGPLSSPFAGEWVSIDTDGSSQTMTIERTDGDAHEIVIHDDSASVCSGAPSTMTGSGRVQTTTKLLIDAEITCDDASTPSTTDLDQELLANLTFVHDPETNELADNLGVVWWREGDPGRILQGSSPFEGSWVVGREGQYFPDSLEIRLVGDEDLHELVMLRAETPQCAGGASTMSGTGRREIDRQQNPGLVRLALVVDLTCDDGSTPIPQSPQEEGSFVNLGISFIHDPVTDELLGSLGSLFIREGAELAQGDPMATVNRMIDAVNARDADAFIDLFAPDGAFDPRGSFGSSAIIVSNSQAISEEPEVRAWMAIQHAWGFAADARSCTEDPSERLHFASESDRWIECEVTARWPKLSLEITDRWRFELRDARLVYWEPVPLDLDPSERTLPLGYPGLEAWEAWLETNHAEDAARWLNPREHPSAAEFEGAADPEAEAARARLVFLTQRSWTIQRHQFSPAGLIPYDPAFADEIDASIHEYLEGQ